MDRRAIWLAAAAWAGSLSGWMWGPVAVLGAILVVGAVCVGLIVTATRPWAVASLGVAMAAGALTGALAADAQRIPDGAQDRSLWAEAVVTGFSQQTQPATGDEPGRMVPLRVHRIGVGERQWRASMPVRVFVADTPEWRDLGIGTQLRTRLRFLPERSLSGEQAASAGEPHVLAPPGGIQIPLNVVRDGLRKSITAAPAGSPDARGLVAGLAVGDESAQSPEFALTMQDAGLAHLTAVSGGNTAIVLVLVIVVSRLTRLPLPVEVAVCATSLAAYVALVGPQPSVIRAAAMGAAGLIGVMLGGVSRGVSILSGCVLILVLVSPGLAVSLGFALSVAATGGILVIAPWLVARTEQIRLVAATPRAVRMAVAVAVAAHVMTSPILAAIGSPAGWTAIPANLVVAPLVAPITILGVGAALVSPFAPPLAVVVAQLAMPMAEWVALVARTAQRTNGDGTDPWPWLALAAAVVLVAVRRFLVPVFGRRLAVLLLATGLVLGLAVRSHLTRPWVPADWRILVCDVGQGTAVLLRDGPGSALLIDTGPRDGRVGDCLRDAGVARVTAVVITHFHADHIDGLPEVLSTRDVGQVLVDPFAEPRPGSAEVLGAVSTADVPAAELTAGMSWAAGELEVGVLWPPVSFAGDPEDANNSSVVMRVVWPDGASVLVTGDVEPESQRRIMASVPRAASDVVIIPHHGSGHQEPGFAAWTGARVAVASAGAGNDYGHPASATLAEYQQAGARSASTDEQGAVAISWRSGGVALTPSRGSGVASKEDG